MWRVLVITMALGATVGCGSQRPSHFHRPVESHESSIRIEAVQMSSMPAASLLYAPRSPHGPVLIALYTNRLALIGPIDGRKIQENTLTKRFGFPHLVYIQDQPLLMNSGDGFSDLYLMDLQGEILWTYEKHRRETQTELAVSVSGQMTFGDLDKDGEPEFYVSSMRPPNNYVHVLNKEGQFLRIFSKRENDSIACNYYPIACQGETFIGATYDYEKRQPLLDFRAASGELKRRVLLETRLTALHPLNWPMEGNYAVLDQKEMFYVLQRDGGIVAKLRVGGIHLNHTIVTAANSRQEYLVLLSTFRRSHDTARLHVLDKNFSRVGGKDVEVTWGICAASPASKEFFLGGDSGIFRCKLVE